jgi:hypothetical protein
MHQAAGFLLLWLAGLSPASEARQFPPLSSPVVAAASQVWQTSATDPDDDESIEPPSFELFVPPACHARLCCRVVRRASARSVERERSRAPPGPPNRDSLLAIDFTPIAKGKPT